jgi:hypothetical protein
MIAAAASAPCTHQNGTPRNGSVMPPFSARRREWTSPPMSVATIMSAMAMQAAGNARRFWRRVHGQ